MTDRSHPLRYQDPRPYRALPPPLYQDLGILVKRDSCDRNAFSLLALVEMGKASAAAPSPV
jgi:hypothetical protein